MKQVLLSVLTGNKLLRPSLPQFLHLSDWDNLFCTHSQETVVLKGAIDEKQFPHVRV